MDGGHDTPAYLYWRMQPLNETGVSIDHDMVWSPQDRYLLLN